MIEKNSYKNGYTEQVHFKQQLPLTYEKSFLHIAIL